MTEGVLCECAWVRECVYMMREQMWHMAISRYKVPVELRAAVVEPRGEGVQNTAVGLLEARYLRVQWEERIGRESVRACETGRELLSPRPTHTTGT